MYIRKTKRVYKGKSYTNHLLVESVLTPKGPRQRTICSLGSLEPAPYEEWRALAPKMESALKGELSWWGSQARTTLLLARARKGRRQRRESATVRRPAGSLVVVDTERVDTEEHLEAGTVHVGHQIWRQLWPISRNVPTQYQRRDPPDFREGTHPISGGPLRFLSAATNDATLANWEEPVSWPKKGSAFVCKLKSKPCPSRGTPFAGLPGYYGFRAEPYGSI